ncbi:MAG: hypothetical protein WBS14_07655, partial [Rhodomicrobium sp.]
ANCCRFYSWRYHSRFRISLRKIETKAEHMAAPTKAATCENPLTAGSHPHMAQAGFGRVFAGFRIKSGLFEGCRKLEVLTQWSSEAWRRHMTTS